MNTNEGSPPATPAEPRFTVSVDEAVLAFAEAGVPRSARTIRRYCEKGHLAASKADSVEGDRYLIEPSSIERRIEEVRQQELVSKHNRSWPDAAGDSQSRPDRAGTDRPTSAEIQELEAKVLDLRITNRGKDYLIKRDEEERSALLEQVATKSHRIGQLEERLELTAPETTGSTQREPVQPEK